MAGKKSDKIKMFFVVGLAVALLFSLYFRLIRSKVSKGADASAATEPKPPQSLPQAILEDKEKRTKQLKPIVNMDLGTVIRDIFTPPAVPKKAVDSPPEKMEEPEEPEPAGPPAFQLKGTIVGGKNPIALIDGHFLRQGDMIGEYQLVWIGKKAVHLRAADQVFTLELMKNE
ncbi:hypothetical protein ACFL9T_15300 [Thermodesulfobacteriota bacterium]